MTKDKVMQIIKMHSFDIVSKDEIKAGFINVETVEFEDAVRQALDEGDNEINCAIYDEFAQLMIETGYLEYEVITSPETEIDRATRLV